MAVISAESMYLTCRRGVRAHAHSVRSPPQLIREPSALYRPRHVERTALYRILETEFDRYVGVYELLKKIFEIDPLLCPRCKVPLQLVSVITVPKIVDTILAHRRKMPAEERELFRERAPPGETTSRTRESRTQS